MGNEVYYSAVDDDWSNADQSIEEVACMILDEMSNEEVCKVKSITIYKGIKKPQHFKQFLCVDWLLDQMSESAYDEGGDWAEDYLDNVTESEKRELEDVIISWAERNNISPSWFMIEDIAEVEFTIPDEWK